MIKLNTCTRQGISSLLIIFICFCSYGQFWPSSEDIFSEAEEYMFSEEYNEALPLYQLLLEKGYDNPNINYKIGRCFLHIQGQKLNALPYLSKSAAKASGKNYINLLDGKNAPLSSIYYLAIAYRLNNKLDEAIKVFEAVKDSLDTDDLENREIVDMHIKRCLNAIELINNPVNIKKEKLDNIINSGFSDYNAMVTNDESVIFYMDKLKFYDAVMQSVKADGAWMKPVNLTPKIKSDGDYTVVGISANGEIMLLCAFDPATSSDIYQSVFDNGKWSKITKLNNHINSKYNETHASLSDDGKVLYFTSNRKGSYGGLDIYKSELDETGNWGPAANLGPVINSPFDEESPFITDDGKKLFFSSQGHYNMGGYDIFYSELSDAGEWSYPVNIGYPLNTTDDDLFFYPVNDGKKGYHSKYNTEEPNDQDIFKYEILSVANPPRYKISGTVEKPDNIEYELDKISVTIINSEDKDTLVTKYCNKQGYYEHKVPSGEYELAFRAKDQQFGVRRVHIPLNFPEEDLIFNAEIEDRFIAKKDTFVIDDIFFDFDSYALNKAAMDFLDRLTGLMEAHSTITMSIKGFTDSIGRSEYNQVLSEKRAESVGTYLADNNVQSERYTTEGFGETRHKAVNSTPEGRQINRRVEIEINSKDENLIFIRGFIVPSHLVAKCHN
jgi:outer membrane protein OmpA-like peptidoglycan-associated protein